MGEPFSSDASRTGPGVHDATPARRRRHPAPPKSRASSRRRLRQIFFSVAAIWGFLAGVAAIIIGLAAAGEPIRGGKVLWFSVFAALLLAVVGGMVAARAYRDIVSGA